MCVCVCEYVLCVCVVCEDNTVFIARQWRHVYVTYEVVLAAPVVRSWSPCTSQGAHTAHHPPLAHWGRSTQPHTPLCRKALPTHVGGQALPHSLKTFPGGQLGGGKVGGGRVGGGGGGIAGREGKVNC